MSTVTRRTGTRMGVAGGSVAAAAAAMVVTAGWGASPAQAQDEGTTNVDVGVQQAITIEDLTESFSLEGDPGEIVTDEEAVSMTIFSNDPAGYSVSVTPQGEEGLTPDNVDADPIPWETLEYEDDDGVYVPLEAEQENLVFTQDAASDPEGDTITHGYEIEIPAVPPDTYSGDLEYIAMVNVDNDNGDNGDDGDLA